MTTTIIWDGESIIEMSVLSQGERVLWADTKFTTFFLLLRLFITQNALTMLSLKFQNLEK